MAEDFKKCLTDSLKDGQRVILIKGGGQTSFSEKLPFAINVLRFFDGGDFMFSQGI